MGAYLNKIYCMMAAIATSYVVNMIYNIKSALAVTCPSVRVCNNVYDSWGCAIVYGVGSATMSMATASGDFPTQSGIIDGTRCDVSGMFSEMEAHASVSGNAPADYGFAGCASRGDAYHLTGEVMCSYTSCYASPVSPTTKNVSCGVVTMCGESTATVSCNNSGSVGFLTNGGKGCACCPELTGDANYRPHGSSIPTVSVIYNASAISSCYIVGQFEDDTGIFQFTDDNRCYYAS